MLTSDQGESGDRHLREEDRYVLIKILPDGTPVAARPTASLQGALEQLAILNTKDGGCWHIFDHQERQKIIVHDG